jgi:hypothetical protein
LNSNLVESAKFVLLQIIHSQGPGIGEERGASLEAIILPTTTAFLQMASQVGGWATKAFI